MYIMNVCDFCTTKRCQKEREGVSEEAMATILKKKANFEMDNSKMMPKVAIVPDYEMFACIDKIFGLEIIVSAKVKHVEDIEVY